MHETKKKVEAAGRSTCIQSMPMTGMGTRSSEPAGALMSSAAVWMDNVTEVATAATVNAVSDIAAREGTKEHAKTVMTATTKYCTSTLMDLNCE